MSDLNSTGSLNHGCGFSYDESSGVCYRTLDFMGFPGYRVGDDGSVWSVRKGHPWKKLRSTTVKAGHVRVFLRPKSFFVQRLVLIAFVGHPLPGQMCRHFPDQNPKNNRIENLRWGTALENQRDRISNGTANRGMNHGRAKLNDSQVIAIRAFYKKEIKTERKIYGLIQRIAEQFGVPNPTVGHIVKNRTWKHLQPEPYDDLR